MGNPEAELGYKKQYLLGDHGFRVEVGGDKMKLERKQGQAMCGHHCQTKKALNLSEW